VGNGPAIPDLTRLREAFASAGRQDNRLADVCYARLFERYPEVKPLFAHMDLERQKRMLMVALDVVVRTLDRSEVTGRYLQSLGEQHAEHGVKPAHYLALGQCLLDSLEELTGAEWNQDLRSAWLAVYHAMANHMLTGARRAGD
jgi:hemoglobin-like flavoprotein